MGIVQLSSTSIKNHIHTQCRIQGGFEGAYTLIWKTHAASREGQGANAACANTANTYCRSEGF